MFSLPVKQQFFNLRIYDIAYIMHFHTTFKSRVLKRSIYIRCELSLIIDCLWVLTKHI